MGNLFNAFTIMTQKFSEIVSQINLGTEQITGVMTSLDNSTNLNSELASQITIHSQELDELSIELNQLISYFKIV